MNPRCSSMLCSSESALCHCETVDVRACWLRVSLDVVCIPSTQRSEAQFLCACVCPHHSNCSTGLQHHQQQQCSFASVIPSPGTAAGKLLLRWAGCLTQQRHSRYPSVRKCNVIFVHHIKNETVITFPDRLVKGVAHRVRLFHAMLVLICICLLYTSEAADE